MAGQTHATILVVDSEPANIELIEAILGDEYDIWKAASCSDAFRIIGRNLPDLILVDLMMLDASGHEICNDLRNREDTKLIPIVMLSSHDDENERLKSLQNGADDFLTTPIDPPALRTRIRTLLKVNTLQKKIVQERNLARKYIDVIGSIMLILDSDLNILLSNRKASQIFGYEDGNLNGLNLIDLFIPEAEREKVQLWLTQSEERDGFVPIENDIINKKGDKRLLQLRKASICDDRGNVSEIVVSAEDVTSRKETEHYLLDANRELETINQIKNEFIANISHELRTPLISIKGFSELLYQERLGGINEKQKSLIGSISRNSEILQKLIESLFYMSSDICKTIQYSSEPCDITIIVQTTIKDISLHFESKKLTPIINISDNLPPVCGNRPYIVRVLMHLLGDVIDASPQGGKVVISVSKKGDYVELFIENFLKSIYMLTSLQQTDMAGINVCREIIDAHMGTLEIREKGGICQIKVLLPTQQSPGHLQ